MSIYRMNPPQFSAYREAANASIMTVCNPAPNEARVFTTPNCMMTVINYGHDGVTLVGDGFGASFMEKHTLKEYRDFCEDPATKGLEVFSRPQAVTIYRTSTGVLTVVDDGSDKLAVIGDVVGVYWGEEAPEYLV
ncbi:MULTISPECIES: hypothetical protein [unclassified Agrobacterium]|uniref:hypothetical protein n=1 Tax=unclassified Agrobacterium TaxID=2632611 RepID=UPI002448D80F|nr:MULTISPECIES: hypothetical protein [unclassified Agrobacterium]MDH0614949.1 hypothetical protein [Agrobacterium sp. GD03872]MDH0698598.1 hypothetical protein [Agrobacterium sp. GD03871]MDH1062011.1 hypothetical protein [Agrobacterium sp. GD03992]MDH2211719.1 hypothetical protein [Agrobacterium sp. GD03643]MDH2220411.1 hypothetical protein [Agrobacterium sp. GD03638]